MKVLRKQSRLLSCPKPWKDRWIIYIPRGLLYQETKRYDESLRCYRNAIHYRPRMASKFHLTFTKQDGRKWYQNCIFLSFTVAHLNAGLVLGILGKSEEAKEMYTKCSQLDGKGLKDPRTHESTRTSALFNLGRVYADEGDYEKAIESYLTAVQRMPPHYQPQVRLK